jgi:hypothetical protein
LNAPAPFWTAVRRAQISWPRPTVPEFGRHDDLVARSLSLLSSVRSIGEGVDREGRRRKARVREGAYCNRDRPVTSEKVPIDGRAAIWAESKPRLPAFVADPDIFPRPSGDYQRRCRSAAGKQGKDTSKPGSARPSVRQLVGRSSRMRVGGSSRSSPTVAAGFYPARVAMPTEKWPLHGLVFKSGNSEIHPLSILRFTHHQQWQDFQAAYGAHKSGENVRGSCLILKAESRLFANIHVN